MIYFGSFFAGVINGAFASGAGNIFVFVLIFILKKETHKARATSLLAMGIVTIITLIRYLTSVHVEVNDVIKVVLAGIIGGYCGQKLMNKIKSKWLNLISGILLVGLSIYSLIRG